MSASYLHTDDQPDRPEQVTAIPRAVTPGWTGIDLIGPPTFRDGEQLPSMALVLYPDGRIAFRHVCDRGERGVIVCAPFLQTDTGRHQVVSRHPWTITPSILCPDCGTHGFVRDGSWVSA